jgi:hypothetical protein
MNTYTVEFATNCPTNGVRVKHRLRIECAHTIPVEEIVAVVESIEAGERLYQEEIADLLAAALPGRQVLFGHHHGVDIETHRDGQVEQGSQAQGATTVSPLITGPGLMNKDTQHD